MGKSQASNHKPGVILARRDTQLRIKSDQLTISCEGNDSGLAFDELTKLQNTAP